MRDARRVSRPSLRNALWCDRRCGVWCVVLCSTAALAQAAPPPPAAPAAATAPPAVTKPVLPPGAVEVPSSQLRYGIDAVPAKLNFDIISFKPCAPDARPNSKIDMPMEADYIAYHCQPIGHLIYFAYGVALSNYNVPTGIPKWADEDLYDFTAKVAPEDFAAWKLLTLSDRRVLMRSLLASEVKLKIHVEPVSQPVYVLTVDKHGPKFKPYKPGDTMKLPDGRELKSRDTAYYGLTTFALAQSMRDLAAALTAHLDRVVLDQTRLEGSFNYQYDLLLGTGIDPNRIWRMGPDDAGSCTTDSLSQIGLRLQPANAAIERLVVDHIEKPQEN